MAKRSGDFLNGQAAALRKDFTDLAVHPVVADFTTPFTLPADHYFFVPQVELSTGDFFWLSSVRPIVAPGTPFPPGVTDLQSWMRNENLDPDWLRIGTDIVGGATPPTFNLAFELDGTAVPEPATVLLLGTDLLGLASRLRRRRTPK